jgi:hypothetical protein
MIQATESQIEKARELLAAFLEGMPELTVIGRDVCELIAECHEGDVRKYVLDSFDNFLDQCTEEVI